MSCRKIPTQVGMREWFGLSRPFLLVTFLLARKEKLPGRRRRTEALLVPDMRQRDMPASRSYPRHLAPHNRSRLGMDDAPVGFEHDAEPPLPVVEGRAIQPFVLADPALAQQRDLAVLHQLAECRRLQPE